MKNKIFNLNNFSKIIKSQGQRIVLCHGAYDLIHYGHISHFKKAKEFGDILVVTITTDKYINKIQIDLL